MDINSLSLTFSAPHIAQITGRTAVSNASTLYAVWRGQYNPGIADLIYRQTQEERKHILKIIAHKLSRETKLQLLSLAAYRI